MNDCYNKDCALHSTWGGDHCWHEDEDYHIDCPLRIKKEDVEKITRRTMNDKQYGKLRTKLRQTNERINRLESQYSEIRKKLNIPIRMKNLN